MASGQDRVRRRRSVGWNDGTPSTAAVLGDINRGLIDVVVVYKVDRLTRSLADFAKMVEVFDAQFQMA
jgi:site-specific DNA recombinase